MNAISLPEEFANGASGNLSLLMASLNTDAIKPLHHVGRNPGHRSQLDAHI